MTDINIAPSSYRRLNNIATIAKADGFLHKNEYKLLHSIGSRMGYSKDCITQIVADAQEIVPISGKDSGEKFSHVMNVFRIAIADGDLDPYEEIQIKNVLNKLGYDEKHSEELITIARKEIS